jgi:hypothetical protein
VAEPSQRAEYYRAWRLAHADELRERRKQYYAEHREKLIARSKAHYAAHREEKLAYAKRYQEEHLAEHRAATARNRKKDPAATKAYHRAYYRAHLDELREAGRVANQKARRKGQKQAEPRKRKAHWTVQNALVAGKITKPKVCAGCGAPTSSRRLHAHHADYDKPLEVRWLCAFCHAAEHMTGA